MAIKLNTEQKKIVEYNGNKFLSVQAGPGSGKTRVIVEKVKYMINELGLNPESFLIITFSIKAADELKDRLIEGDIPASDVQKMQISTIHSFCFKILEETGTVGLDIVADGEKLNLFIKKHLKELGFEGKSISEPMKSTKSLKNTVNIPHSRQIQKDSVNTWKIIFQ